MTDCVICIKVDVSTYTFVQALLKYQRVYRIRLTPLLLLPHPAFRGRPDRLRFFPGTPMLIYHYDYCSSSNGQVHLARKSKSSRLAMLGLPMLGYVSIDPPLSDPERGSKYFLAERASFSSV